MARNHRWSKILSKLNTNFTIYIKSVYNVKKKIKKKKCLIEIVTQQLPKLGRMY